MRFRKLDSPLLNSRFPCCLRLIIISQALSQIVQRLYDIQSEDRSIAHYDLTQAHRTRNLLGLVFAITGRFKLPAAFFLPFPPLRHDESNFVSRHTLSAPLKSIALLHACSLVDGGSNIAAWQGCAACDKVSRPRDDGPDAALLVRRRDASRRRRSSCRSAG
jgi:hypothetical protein